MGVKEIEIAALEAELADVQTAIERILKGGQSWRKGGSTGFASVQADLKDLQAHKREIKAKLATWGIYQP